MGFRVWGLGFGVQGLGFGVWGSGFKVWGLGFRIYKIIYIKERRLKKPILWRVWWWFGGFKAQGL